MSRCQSKDLLLQSGACNVLYEGKAANTIPLTYFIFLISLPGCYDTKKAAQRKLRYMTHVCGVLLYKSAAESRTR